jgi:Protein of unknown function (DUF2442)
MSTSASAGPRIEHVQGTDTEIIARLADGRVISVPLAWSWRLSDATPQQRAHFRLIGSGQGIHWPDVGRGHQRGGHDPRRSPPSAEIHDGSRPT